MHICFLYNAHLLSSSVAFLICIYNIDVPRIKYTCVLYTKKFQLGTYKRDVLIGLGNFLTRLIKRIYLGGQSLEIFTSHG